MSGAREKVKYPVMDRQFIETMSGKPNEGGSYNFLKGSSLPVGGGNVRKEGRGPTLWDSVEKVWNFLFKGGSLAPPPRVVPIEPGKRVEPEPITPEERQRMDEMLSQQGEALRRKRLGLGQ